jgi:hypothetical protein
VARLDGVKRSDEAGWAHSALSSPRAMKSCRAGFERPAIPIDSAAPAYQVSVLKIARLIRFFGCREAKLRERNAGFLALPGFDVPRLDIILP